MVKRERRFGATIRGVKVEIRITSKKGVETVCTGGNSAWYSREENQIEKYAKIQTKYVM